MAIETTRWGILYCPKTGVRNKRKRWDELRQLLDARGVQYDMVQSEKPDSVS